MPPTEHELPARSAVVSGCAVVLEGQEPADEAGQVDGVLGRDAVMAGRRQRLRSHAGQQVAGALGQPPGIQRPAAAGRDHQDGDAQRSKRGSRGLPGHDDRVAAEVGARGESR
jgi:hypothetical protein